MTPSGAGARVLVVGAGIIGRSVAYFLSRLDFEVDLLDAGRGPSPTTRASLGVLSHYNGGDNPYAQLFRDGHALHAELAANLAEETGLDVGWRPLGGIELFYGVADQQQIEKTLSFNRERSCPVDLLNEHELRNLEPALADGVGEGLYYPGDHRVDPLKLGEALLAAAVQRGVCAYWDERVERVIQHNGRVEVRTNRADHQADFAVLAAGAWTGGLSSQLGAQVEVRPVRGQQVRCAGSPTRHLLRVAGHHMIPDGDQTVVGATVEEVGFQLGTTSAAALGLMARIDGILGRTLPLLSQWAGLRPKAKGGRPLIGPLHAAPQVFVASGHYKNGVLLGPITGQIVARWIAEGIPGRDMSRFTPER